MMAGKKCGDGCCSPGAAMWLTTQWTLAIQMAWPKRTNNYGRNGSLSRLHLEPFVRCMGAWEPSWRFLMCSASRAHTQHKVDTNEARQKQRRTSVLWATREALSRSHSRQTENNIDGHHIWDPPNCHSNRILRPLNLEKISPVTTHAHRAVQFCFLKIETSVAKIISKSIRRGSGPGLTGVENINSLDFRKHENF